MAKTWSRPPSTKVTKSRNHSAATWHGSSVSERYSRVVSGGGRRHTQALAAVAGKESIPARYWWIIFTLFDVNMSAPIAGQVLGVHRDLPASRAQDPHKVRRSLDSFVSYPLLFVKGIQNDSSSEETASRDSAESFTRLYSARGFSPTSDKTESSSESPIHDTASD